MTLITLKQSISKFPNQIKSFFGNFCMQMIIQPSMGNADMGCIQSTHRYSILSMSSDLRGQMYSQIRREAEVICPWVECLNSSIVSRFQLITGTSAAIFTICRSQDNIHTTYDASLFPVHHSHAVTSLYRSPHRRASPLTNHPDIIGYSRYVAPEFF